MKKLLICVAALVLVGCATDNTAISQASGGVTGAEGTASGSSGNGTGTGTTGASTYGSPASGAR